MDTLTLITTIAAVHTLFAISPGPNFVIVSSIAVSQSRFIGMMAACGVFTATLISSTLTAFGLNVIFTIFPLLYKIMFYTSAAYLLYLSIKMLKSAYLNAPFLQNNEKQQSLKPFQAYRIGLITNLTNPKSFVYYASFFALMLPPNTPSFQLIIAVITAFSISAIWHTLVVLFFTLPQVKAFYLKISRIINGFTGGLLLYFGAKLVYTGA